MLKSRALDFTIPKDGDYSYAYVVKSYKIVKNVPPFHRIIGLILSFVCSLVLGIQLAFTVYALPLKQSFGLSQTELEIVASASMAGMGVSFLQACLTHHLGYMITYWITLVIGVGSVLLLSLAAHQHEFFSTQPLLVAFFQFLMSATFRMSLWTLSGISVRNFSPKHTGKITSTYLAFIGLGKAFYVTLYRYAFAETENLTGFFLATAGTYGVLFFLCILFHRPIPEDELKLERGTEDIQLIARDDDEDDNATKEIGAKTLENTGFKKEFTLKGMLLNPFFQIMVWSSGLFYACAYAYLNNLTTMLHSMRFTRPDIFIYVISATIATTRFSAGAIFDYLGTMRSRFFLLLACYTSFIIVISLNLLWLQVKWVAVVSTVFGGIAIGLANCVPIALLTVYFGKENYSIMSGAMYFLVSVFCVLIQVAVGQLYDDNVTTDSGTAMFCYGKGCFFRPYILLLSLTVLVVPVQIVNMCLHS